MAAMRRTYYHSEFCSFGDFSDGSASFIDMYIYIFFIFLRKWKITVGQESLWYDDSTIL